MEFVKDKVYRNKDGKDMDIYVVKISFVDEKRTKMHITYLFRSTGLSNRVGDNVTIWAKDYHKWEEISYGQDTITN